MLLPYVTHDVRTSTEFCEFLEWLPRQPFVAVDTETSGHDVYSSQFRVRLLQIGSATDAWVFDWDGWGRPAAVALLEHRGRIIMHNAAYDMAVLRRQGIVLDWLQVIDTMLAMRIAEPLLLAGLKEAGNRHVDEDTDLSQKELKDAFRKNGWDWDTVPIDLPVYRRYAALDVIITSRLYLSDVVQAALTSPVWQTEMDVAALCAQMSERGMRIDIEAATLRRDTLMAEAEIHRDRLLADHGINAGSPAQCAHWFLADPDAGPLMTKKTDKGAAAVDKEILDKITVLAPGTQAAAVAAGVKAVRDREKIAKSYFSVFIDKADINGVVHPQILTSEARSSRMSIRGPALQTLPKDDSAGVRSVVLARTDDEALISSDWDQIEMRLAAVFSKDAGLQQAFIDADATGGNFFVNMGSMIYQDPTFSKSNPLYRIVKNCLYGSLYGAGATKIAATAQIAPTEARRVLNSIFTAYPGLRTLMANAEGNAKMTGHITTLGGRVLDVPQFEAYKGLNYLIQGSASFLLKRCLIELACAGLDEYLMVPVHDEVVFSVPTDIVEDVRPIIAEIMPVRGLPITIGAEPSLPMSRWGQLAV